MGRQIQIIATHADCWNLIDFIAETSPVRVFGSVGKTTEDLWLRHGEIPKNYSDRFNVWPTIFPWTPQYGTSIHGNVYVENTSAAPIIEIDASCLPATWGARIYWSKGFGTTQPLLYDVPAFDKLIDRLFRHVRKIGQRTPCYENQEPPYKDGFRWALPDAWTHRAEFKLYPPLHP